MERVRSARTGGDTETRNQRSASQFGCTRWNPECVVFFLLHFTIKKLAVLTIMKLNNSETLYIAISKKKQ